MVRQKHILIALLLVLIPLLSQALDVPPLSGRVNDYAGLLSPTAKSMLEQKLAAFEQSDSTQVVVLTVSTLQGDDIDQFAIHVADQWKIGQQGKDNGVILVLATAERRVRIEVGMGLQGVLPDITAGQIIRNVMTPYFRKGDYDRGVEAGVEAIVAATRGEFKAAPGDGAHRVKRQKGSSFLSLLFIIGIITMALGSVSKPLGGVAGSIGLPIAASVLFPWLALKYLLVLAAVGFVAGLLLSFLGLFGRGGGGGGFYGGGFGGGGFGGGGFSGGGGGFDGGGASDGW
ncbi:MAG: TPM domain-containing protein [Desulfuromonadaceae bacterium]|nr:TPM domain-containing protein [Desulfuromonadaceae bacterium]MDD2854160.1 TPM domain-containing protein [Desulfuromonadaceae bacterium]